MKKLFYSTALVSALLLGACSDDTTPSENSEETAKENIEVEDKGNESWQTSLEEIINSSDTPSDKFYALEKVMLEAEVAESDIELFKEEVLSAYKEKTYLADPTNDSVMLNYIFKSYIIEQNETGAWKEFAFDFFQNVKYVYRGVDAPDSDAVKANEEQMNKALEEL